MQTLLLLPRHLSTNYFWWEWWKVNGISFILFQEKKICLCSRKEISFMDQINERNVCKVNNICSAFQLLAGVFSWNNSCANPQQTRMRKSNGFNTHALFSWLVIVPKTFNGKWMRKQNVANLFDNFLDENKLNIT